MIKFEKTEVVGWEAAIRGMRNPNGSWAKSDSLPVEEHTECVGTDHCCFGANFDCTERCHETSEAGYIIGPNDFSLMGDLRDSSAENHNFNRMIMVYVDITAPLYWWKKFDTYKVGTVTNTCNLLNMIVAKEFELDDFSHEHLGVHIPAELNDGEECYQNLWEAEFTDIIKSLNIARRFYIDKKNSDLKKEYSWQLIQLLPSSYNQKRTVMMSYEVLANIYKSQRHNVLDEWSLHEHKDDNAKPWEFGFCDWVHTLPYSELITETGFQSWRVRNYLKLTNQKEKRDLETIKELKSIEKRGKV